MSLFRTRKSAQWHIKLRSKDGVWVQRSCGTRDSRTARRINDTIDALGNAAARAWDLLDLVVDGSLSVAALFDVYALADGDLARVRAHLNDIDVAPLVDAWYEAMQAPAQGVSLDTAKHYRSAVRSMIPAKRPFTRSALTRRSVERWIAAMTWHRAPCGSALLACAPSPSGSCNKVCSQRAQWIASPCLRRGSRGIGG
jgi:cobalamin biosynthesis protein CobD/CbiB